MGKNKEFKSFLVLLFFSLLILLFDRFQLLQPVKAFSEQLFSPPKKAIYQNWQGIKSEIKEIKKLRNCDNTKELEEKIEKLKDEITILNTKYSILNTKYLAAQRLLGTPLPSEWQFLPAQAAGLVEGILTIDKGENDGVKKDRVVMVEDIYVGKVERITKYQAWVELPTAKGSKLLAKVIPSWEAGSEITARGLLVGYGDKMKLEKVLQEEQLSEGDLVVTGEFPPNLVIGKITSVIKNEVEIYQLAEVKPSLDYQRLEVVFLLK